MQDLIANMNTAAGIGAFFIAAIPVVVLLKRARDKKSGKISVTAKDDSASLAVKPTVTSSNPDSKTQNALTDEKRVSSGLLKTRSFLKTAFQAAFSSTDTKSFYSEIEEALLAADVGIDLTDQIIEELKSRMGFQLSFGDGLKNDLKNELHTILQSKIRQNVEFKPRAQPHVIMVVGVNGAGKTTTIAKLCSNFKKQNYKILVGAADTFRAAATEQLKTWTTRLGIEGVFQAEGSDPSAVAFDTTQAATARAVDLAIIDTAGRLHTKSGLMDELTKMKRVVGKAKNGAPEDIWLVLDGTMGQNALQQAQEFHKALGLTGLIITKLDGSAKGGALLSISIALNLPVFFIGVGESPEDLVPFKSDDFIQAILEDL